MPFHCGTEEFTSACPNPYRNRLYAESTKSAGLLGCRILCPQITCHGERRMAVARRASTETVVSSPRAPPCPRTSTVAGHTTRPWNRRKRQPDGRAAGGHENFFQEPHCLHGAPCNPPFRLHLMRNPVNRPCTRRAAFTDRRCRAPTLCKIAHQVCVTAGFRCASGRPRRGRMMQMSMRGILKKILMAPCRASSFVPTPRLRLQQASAQRPLNSLRAPSHDSAHL